jgi:hypothetical protein
VLEDQNPLSVLKNSGSEPVSVVSEFTDQTAKKNPILLLSNQVPALAEKIRSVCRRIYILFGLRYWLRNRHDFFLLDITIGPLTQFRITGSGRVMCLLCTEGRNRFGDSWGRKWDDTTIRINGLINATAFLRCSPTRSQQRLSGVDRTRGVIANQASKHNLS